MKLTFINRSIISFSYNIVAYQSIGGKMRINTQKETGFQYYADRAGHPNASRNHVERSQSFGVLSPKEDIFPPGKLY